MAADGDLAARIARTYRSPLKIDLQQTVDRAWAEAAALKRQHRHLPTFPKADAALSARLDQLRLWCFQAEPSIHPVTDLADTLDEVVGRGWSVFRLLVHAKEDREYRQEVYVKAGGSLSRTDSVAEHAAVVALYRVSDEFAEAIRLEYARLLACVNSVAPPLLKATAWVDPNGPSITSAGTLLRKELQALIAAMPSDCMRYFIEGTHVAFMFQTDVKPILDRIKDAAKSLRAIDLSEPPPGDGIRKIPRAGTSPNQRAKVKLVVSTKKVCATVNGAMVRLTNRRQAEMLAAVLNGEGNWVPKDAFAERHERPDRLFKKLPREIRHHIEGKTGSGYRFVE